MGPLPSMPRFLCSRQPAAATVDTWSFIILSPRPPQDDQSKHFLTQFPELSERWGVGRHACTHVHTDPTCPTANPESQGLDSVRLLSFNKTQTVERGEI